MKSRLEQLDSANKYAYIYAVGTDILFTADDADAKSADLIVKHLSDYGLMSMIPMHFLYISVIARPANFLFKLNNFLSATANFKNFKRTRWDGAFGTYSEASGGCSVRSFFL